MIRVFLTNANHFISQCYYFERRYKLVNRDWLLTFRVKHSQNLTDGGFPVSRYSVVGSKQTRYLLTLECNRSIEHSVAIQYHVCY